jgi:hypothetical protein
MSRVEAALVMERSRKRLYEFAWCGNADEAMSHLMD